MTIRDAFAYERCSDHTAIVKAVVTITSGNHTVPLCKTCLAAFWRGIAARIDDAAEYAALLLIRRNRGAMLAGLAHSGGCAVCDDNEDAVCDCDVRDSQETAARLDAVREQMRAEECGAKYWDEVGGEDQRGEEAVTKSEEIATIIEILRILHAVSSASLKAVPVMFRPVGLQGQLDQVQRLLEALGSRS